MIPLVGLCLLVMAVLHWVLEPLESVFTWTLQLKLLPWLLGLILIWLFAGVLLFVRISVRIQKTAGRIIIAEAAAACGRTSRTPVTC